MPGRRSSQKKPIYPNRIAVLRAQAGLTQQDLGPRIGMAWQTLGKLERGESRLRMEVAQAIAHELKRHPLELLPDGESFGGQEKVLLEIYQAMTPEQRDNLLRVAHALLTPSTLGTSNPPVVTKAPRRRA